MGKRGQYSEEQKIATMKYLADNFEKIHINVRKGKKEKIKQLAASKGLSTSAYIIELIERDAELSGFDISIPPTPSQQPKEKPMSEENK